MARIVQEQRSFSRPKEFGRPCEDFILGCRTQGRYALSDGASISYDSRGWARTLCRQFMVDTNVGAIWLDAARERFVARSAPPIEDWAAAHAFERGSYATFLGLTITDAAIMVHAIGDTVLFVVAPDRQLSMFPKMEADDFVHDPILLCSRAGHGAFPDTDEAFSNAGYARPAPPDGWGGTRLIAVTDALAEWIVRSPETTEWLARLEQTIGHPDGESFQNWAGNAIASGEIRRDDCAMLMIRL